tara:strand:- start:3236 stop:3481 length:246 start_codon:yes stop_codon:yes gene_type:complete
VETKALDVLDLRIKGLLQVVRDLKRENSIVVGKLEETKLRLEKQSGKIGRWENERKVIRERIESVLNELELIRGASRGTGG